MSKEIKASYDELASFAQNLDSLMGKIIQEVLPPFSTIKNNPCYIEGSAEEEVERIFNSSGRADFSIEMLEVAEDYYGKIQMLATYYSLLSEYVYYCMDEYEYMDRYLSELFEKGEF